MWRMHISSNTVISRFSKTYLVSQLAEWMMAMRADAIPEECSRTMLACFPAFKYAEKYTEASMWSRMVPYK